MHLLTVHSRHTPAAKLERKYPGATLIDLTSRAPEPWVRFSPFFPHGGVPVPGAAALESQSVEGIWQALKVFETDDVDLAKLDVTSMRGLKRTVRKFGAVRGHRVLDRAPDAPDALLDYLEARRAIYLPAYRFALEHHLTDEVAKLRALWSEGDLVLLDYETNGDVDDPRKPLSHAWLVALWLRDAWPEERPIVL